MYVLVAMVCIIASTGFMGTAKVVQGKVISFTESFPLEGVTVQVKGTKNITGTQPDGIFSIEVNPGDKTLVFSLSGFQTEEIKIIPRKQDYDIILKPL